MKFLGHLDLCDNRLIEGWLYCDATPDEPFQLQVFAGDELIGECSTDRYRKDLQDAGYGSGHCGFSFTLPEEFQGISGKNIRLRLVGAPLYLMPDEFTVCARGEGGNLEIEALDVKGSGPRPGRKAAM